MLSAASLGAGRYNLAQVLDAQLRHLPPPPMRLDNLTKKLRHRPTQCNSVIGVFIFLWRFNGIDDALFKHGLNFFIVIMLLDILNQLMIRDGFVK